MAKLPEFGKVKTRLAAEVGKDKALEIYSTMLSRLNSLLLSLDTEVHIHYDGNGGVPADFFPSFRHIPQVEGDLGLRMKAVIQSSMDIYGGPVILIGSDIPDLNKGVFQNAIELLETNEVVLGPSLDGGYYLIAMHALHPELFEGIEWSTDSVRKQTIAKCEDLHLKVAFTKELNDIDTFEDLKSSTLWSEVSDKIENYGSADSTE